MVNIDDFCAKHGCTRKELLEMVDEIVTNVNTMSTNEIKHELAEDMSKDLIKAYQTEHLGHDKELDN